MNSPDFEGRGIYGGALYTSASGHVGVCSVPHTLCGLARDYSIDTRQGALGEDVLISVLAGRGTEARLQTHNE